MNKLDEELRKRGTDKPVEEWFHSIFYCISCGGRRVEEVDVEIIKKFIENKYKVIIILTMADSLSEEKEKEFKQAIKGSLGQSLPIISTCSEEGVIRINRQEIHTTKFGKEEVEKHVYINFWDSIVLRLPSRCKSIITDYIYQWKDQQFLLIESLDKNDQPLIDIQTVLHKNFEIFQKDINNKVKLEISRTMEIFGLICEALNYQIKFEDNFKDYSSFGFSESSAGIHFYYSYHDGVRFYETSWGFVDGLAFGLEVLSKSIIGVITRGSPGSLEFYRIKFDRKEDIEKLKLEVCQITNNIIQYKLETLEVDIELALRDLRISFSISESNKI